MDILLPKFEETSEDAMVVKWLKAIGDRVIEGEDLVEVETSKFTQVIVAPCTGILSEIKVPEGTDVLVGETLAVINSGA